MASVFPPLPTDLRTEQPSAGLSTSAFSAGLPGMMQTMQQLEALVQQLARQMPPLAPILAEFVTQLRLAIPSVMSAEAGVPTQAPLPSPPMERM